MADIACLRAESCLIYSRACRLLTLTHSILRLYDALQTFLNDNHLRRQISEQRCPWKGGKLKGVRHLPLFC